MLFTDDTTIMLQAAVVLVNSAVTTDTLTTVEELDRWYAEFMHTDHRAAGERELESVRAVRHILYELLSSDRDRTRRAGQRAARRVRGHPPAGAARPVGLAPARRRRRRDPATRIVVDTAMAMIDVVRDDQLSRFGICADDTCTGIVLDLSRNRSRRFCSTACGNRNAVAAYRARQAKD